MGKYCTYYLAVKRESYEQAQDILSKVYDRGDIDRISVEFRSGQSLVLIGLECSSDDYLFIEEELRRIGAL